MTKREDEERLDDMLQHLREIEFRDTTEPFRVETLAQADWCVEKIKAAQNNIDERAGLATTRIQALNAQIAAIRAWQEEACREDYQTIETMELFLKPFAEAKLEGGRKKSMTLPGATLSFSSQQPEYQKNDDDILAWAASEEMSQYIRTKESLAWDELKRDCHLIGGRLVAPTGEIVPGVTVKEREDKFRVKLDKKEENQDE